MVYAASIPVMLPRGPTFEQVRLRLEQIDEARWYSNFGAQERDLRARYATFLGVDPEQVATASNATMAIVGASVVAEARRWVLPSYTFAATPAAVLTAGQAAEFHDIRPEDWWLDLSVAPVDSSIGCIPVAPFGVPLDLDSWPRDSDVIIDAAASLGTQPELGGRLPERWAVVFSLHATKVLGAGEGGLVVFGDADRAQRFRAWSNFGFSGSRESMLLGTNAKMSEIQAAYAHAALDDWETERSEWLDARAKVEALRDSLSLGAQPGSSAGVSPYWIAAFADVRTTTRVEQELKDSEIGTRRWWGLGCHQMPAFRHVPRRALDVTDHVAATNLGLPMFRGITQQDCDRIAEGLKRAREVSGSW